MRERRSKSVRVAAALAAPLLYLLAACGGGDPYVLSDYRSHQHGVVEVCFDEGKSRLADATRLADDVCRQYDRMAELELRQADQCNWATPTLALYYCVARPGETPAPLVPQQAPLRRNLAPSPGPGAGTGM